MAFVATATLVGGGSALLGGALIGAGVGGLYSAITGDGDILNSMLTGGLLGGAAGGIGAAMAPNAAVASASPFYTAAPAATAVKTGTAATAGGSVGGISAGGAFTPTVGSAAKFTVPAVTQGISGTKMLGYGLAGTAGMQLLGGRQQGPGAGQVPDPGTIRPFEYSSTPNEPTGTYPSPYATAEYESSGNPILDTRERNYFDQGFAAMQPYSAKTGTVNPNLEPITMAAKGGLMFDDESGMDEARGLTQGNLQKGLFGMGYAAGGHLGDYSDGGRLLKGPGDGVSDDIPATIAGKQPARLADGEFVIPARIVSELGNGSTDAGAKRLYAMMDRIQNGRKKTMGKKNVAKDTNAKKHLLA